MADMSRSLHTAYWPPISWWQTAIRQNILLLESWEHYQKGSWRNRCWIAGPNGPQLLSVPLAKGKNNRMPIRQVQIAYDEDWRGQHWKSIQTAYGNAPYFIHYADSISTFYQKRPALLFDFNWEIIRWCLNALDVPVPIACTSRYLAHPGELKPATQPYPQVFADRFGFQTDLSVLDLLMCCGKQAKEVLKKSIS